MDTQPPPFEPNQPIDPTIPGELPPAIQPDEFPDEPEGFPEDTPDFDEPGTGPDEMTG